MMKQRLPMIFHKNIIYSFIVETIAKIAIILHHREELEYFTNCSILSILFHEIKYEQVKYTLNPWLNIAKYVTFVEMVFAKRMYNILRRYRDNYLFIFSKKVFWLLTMSDVLHVNFELVIIYYYVLFFTIWSIWRCNLVLPSSFSITFGLELLIFYTV